MATQSDFPQFLANLIHDLKEPTRLALTYSALLERELKALPATAQEYLNYIKTGSQRLEAMIYRLIRLSEVFQSSGKLRPLGETIRVTADQFTSDKPVSVYCDIPSDLNDITMAEQHLRLLLGEILDNAWQFRHVERSPEIKLSVRLVSDRLQITLADNGVGLPSKGTVPAIAPFKRFHPRTSQMNHGLGLYICGQITTLYGGNFFITQPSENGFEVSFQFPISHRSITPV